MRDHGRRLALSLVLGLGSIATAIVAPAATFAATTATTSPTTTTTTCDEGRWPLSAQGQPLTFKAGARAGDYIWHSSTGWHLRLTHPGTGAGRLQRDHRLERAAQRGRLQARVG